MPVAKTPLGLPLNFFSNALHGYVAGTDDSATTILLANPYQAGTAFPANTNTALEYAAVAMQISLDTAVDFSIGYDDDSTFRTCWVHSLPVGFGNIIFPVPIRLGVGHNTLQVKSSAVANYKVDIFYALVPVET